MAGYVSYIRSKVGHDRVQLVFVAGAIFNEKGEILLQERGDTHTWGLPAGVLEIGESLEQTLAREVSEETGLSIEGEMTIGIYSDPAISFFTYPNGDQVQYVGLLCTCKVVGGELKADKEESLSLQYFSRDNLPVLMNKIMEEMIHDAFAAGPFLLK